MLFPANRVLQSAFSAPQNFGGSSMTDNVQKTKASNLSPGFVDNSDSSRVLRSSAGPVETTSNNRQLDVTRFVVLGEGLAAGMADFSLYDEAQRYSFPAQMARQMGASFVQPLIQPPGIGDVPGFEPWSVVAPSPLQSTVVDRIPPEQPSNLSVPGFKVADAIRMRPQEPMVDRTNSKQTTVNLLLGLSEIAYGLSRPWPTQLEKAVRRKPTLAVVELGFTEALDAAIARDPARLSDLASFRRDFSMIVAELRAAGARVVLLTVPNPVDTAFFSTIQAAAPIVKLDAQLLIELWNLRPTDLLTVSGLNDISFQLYAASIGPSSENSICSLQPDAILSGDIAQQLRSAVNGLNQEIASVAAQEGALVYDLNALIQKINCQGLAVAGRTITGEYLGGFYSLNGYYPGATGQAIIANDILDFLNRKFGVSFPPVNLAQILQLDRVAAYQRAAGPNWSRQDLTAPRPLPIPPASPYTGPLPPPQQAVSQVIETTPRSLQLPPGLEQVLPVETDHSYFGDALVAQNCSSPETIQWASCGTLYFRGLAMMNSHLSGNLRIKFSPPVNDWTTFQVSFEKGLAGTDSYLAAPVYFRMPGKQQFVGDVPGFVSKGRLNLKTGQVDHTPGALNIYVNFFNSALFALVRVNSNFPKIPLSFPGPYGSATAQFEQRPDGKLDFTFYGSTFVPLGTGSAFPLNFCGPSRQFASIPASGTALHPHLSLTTKTTPVEEQQAICDIPFNTVQEFTFFSPASSFGDLFTLIAPEVGGPGLGRSRLLGRAQIQFGPPSRNSVAIAVSTTTSGGILAPLSPTPLAQLFPGRLTPGPEGLYENLRFPFRTYSLNDLSVLDDPFDLSVAALDLRTGKTLQPLLHRGFINQDLIFALLRVEPRTPKSSFFFRGPAVLMQGRGGQKFSFVGQVHIPYDAGYLSADATNQPPLLFPDPNLATAFPVVGGGSLDPYLWIWAIRHNDGRAVAKSGQADHAVSSRGEVFSFYFSLPGNRCGTEAVFRYENHTQQGSFRMHSLAWVDFGHSDAGDSVDTVTFSGFGVWSKNGVELVTQAATQFFYSREISYAGIQVGLGGEISNVNFVIPATALPVPGFALPLPPPASLDASQSRAEAPHNPKQSSVDQNGTKRGPMYSHIIELTAKPGQATALVNIIRDRAIPEIIRGSQGFIDEIVLLSDTDPNHVTAISFWKSKQDGDFFFANGFAKVSAMTQPYLSAKPERQGFVVGASTNDNIAGWK